MLVRGPTLRHSVAAGLSTPAAGQQRTRGRALHSKLRPPALRPATRAAQVVGALMHEIECILNEYLSFNWDRLDGVLAANRHLLREDGLACPWKSAPSLEVPQPPRQRSSRLPTLPALPLTQAARSGGGSRRRRRCRAGVAGDAPARDVSKHVSEEVRRAQGVTASLRERRLLPCTRGFQDTLGILGACACCGTEVAVWALIAQRSGASLPGLGQAMRQRQTLGALPAACLWTPTRAGSCLLGPCDCSGQSAHALWVGRAVAAGVARVGAAAGWHIAAVHRRPALARVSGGLGRAGAKPGQPARQRGRQRAQRPRVH